jgi:hypothetical protein
LSSAAETNERGSNKNASARNKLADTVRIDGGFCGR